MSSNLTPPIIIALFMQESICCGALVASAWIDRLPPHGPHNCSELPRLQRFEEAHEGRVGAPALHGVRLREVTPSERLRFHVEVDFRVDVGGVEGDMTQPRADGFRFQLLKSLHLPLPTGIRQEQALWAALQALSTLGENGLEISYQHDNP